MFSQTELIYSIACTVYVVTCLMFAAVRWFHVCPEAKEQKSYYYPDRKMATLFYAVPIILLPYILYPNSRESWLLVKGYYPLTHFYYCAILLFNYFGKVRQWERWRLSGIISSIMVFSPIIILLGIALWPGFNLTDDFENILTNIIITIGILMTAYCGLSMYQVLRWVRNYDTDSFSNPDDFPLAYARKVLFVPILHAILIWPVVLFNNHTWLASIQFALSVFNVVFLISALPSKRKGILLEQMIENSCKSTEVIDNQIYNYPPPISQDRFLKSSESTTENKSEEATNAYVEEVQMPHTPQKTTRKKTMPSQTKEKIATSIKVMIEERQQFLNPHLSLDDVSEACGYSHSYVSSVLQEQFGGFFNYVNLLRIRHVDYYMSQHPEVTKEEAIIKSGFKDRQTYYRIKKHLFQNDSHED